ncbi:MAG TPA: hypothetical protein VFF79_11100 [Conexibacter sp.]|jgi:hypothetical protein|nr:hypothetical protein [Conexibacter sp.]
MRRSALVVALAGVLLSTFVNVAPAEGAASWRLEQPSPPAGVPFKVPLGRPGDLQCWSATRCLLAVEGNATIPQGLLAYDGVSWHQLSTVCGGPADSTRIVWAGPDEFWTITAPSPPRLGGGLGLCHFRDGVVIASYSTADESPDPFRPMDAGACMGPDDCWFAGVGSQDPSGQRVGAYHLHWDGQDLVSTYAPQGRGVSDLIASGGRWYETTFVGVQREDPSTPVTLALPEFQPFTIHELAGGAFADAPFLPQHRAGVPDDGTELLAADAAGGAPWFVGGGAASGPSAPGDDNVARPPIAVRFADGFYRELALDETPFGAHDRFTDVAAVPGADDAWTTVQSYAERGSTTARARVAHLHPDGSVTVEQLPAGGAGRGAAARIEFTSPTEGWMVTNGGWLFHYTDGAPRAADADPAFQQLITYRPNEAVAQAIPDVPPADDSQLFAPPPPVEPQPTAPPKTHVTRIKALMTRISKPRVDGRLRLHLAFTLRRKAKVALLARRRGKVVASTQFVLLAPGRHAFVLQLSRDKWPDALRFRTADVTLRGRGGGSHGGDPNATVTAVR